MEETKILDFDSFVEKLKSKMEERYTPDNVRIAKVTKNNGTALTGISVKVNSDETVLCPTLYIENIYNSYLRQHDFEKTLEETIETLEMNISNNEIDKEIVDNIHNFHKIKEFILPYLVNTGLNKNLLQDVPNGQFLDLSIVYRIHFNKNDCNTTTSLIHNNLMRMWNITEEELHEVAMKNLYEMNCSSTKPVIYPIAIELFQKLHDSKDIADREWEIFTQILENMDENNRMDIVTNQAKLYGASILLNDRFMKEIYKKYNRKMFVIPSSIHEILLTPYSEERSYELNAMIPMVNQESVNTVDILSSHFYILTEDGVSIG